MKEAKLMEDGVERRIVMPASLPTMTARYELDSSASGFTCLRRGCPHSPFLPCLLTPPCPTTLDNQSRAVAGKDLTTISTISDPEPFPNPIPVCLQGTPNIDLATMTSSQTRMRGLPTPWIRSTSFVNLSPMTELWHLDSRQGLCG